MPQRWRSALLGAAEPLIFWAWYIPGRPAAECRQAASADGKWLVAYRALADLVVLLHLAFILFVVLGGLLALRWWWALLLHLPAASWGVFIEVSGGFCPLTPLENWLRRRAGSSGYPGGFIEHYLLQLIYPPGLTHQLQLALGLLVLLANLVAYALVVYRWVSKRRLAT